jgi:2-alkyl-3-oxoalkanoate reductase
MITTHGTPGICNVVDDESAPASTWLPFLANILGAKSPHEMPVWLAKLVIGDFSVAPMTKVRGGSNAKTKREFAWQPVYPSWGRGFLEGLG